MLKIYMPPRYANIYSLRVTIYMCKEICHSITGFCGNYDGIKANDLRTRTGDPVPNNYAGYKQIANSYNLDQK